MNIKILNEKPTLEPESLGAKREQLRHIEEHFMQLCELGSVNWM